MRILLTCAVCIGLGCGGTVADDETLGAASGVESQSVWNAESGAFLQKADTEDVQPSYIVCDGYTIKYCSPCACYPTQWCYGCYLTGAAPNCIEYNCQWVERICNPCKI